MLPETAIKRISKAIANAMNPMTAEKQAIINHNKAIDDAKAEKKLRNLRARIEKAREN